ncbi:MAG TPA: NifB/NifX family molybdenum-iron cluster-binding protein [Bacilli bacterium]|nr:NifB/NifX family molybdenum-iron cluster-binding protein [Bacilli bacterium]
MKIAIPVDEKSMNSPVCVSFGRAPYFLIYDIDTSESVFINNLAASSQGGAGIRAAQLIADNAVDALLTFRCGQNAADVFNAANIRIYKIINGSIEENINAFKDEKLSLLGEIHAGFHGHGNR